MTASPAGQIAEGSKTMRGIPKGGHMAAALCSMYSQATVR